MRAAIHSCVFPSFSRSSAASSMSATVFLAETQMQTSCVDFFCIMEEIASLLLSSTSVPTTDSHAIWPTPRATYEIESSQSHEDFSQDKSRVPINPRPDRRLPQVRPAVQRAEARFNERSGPCMELRTP